MDAYTITNESLCLIDDATLPLLLRTLLTLNACTITNESLCPIGRQDWASVICCKYLERRIYLYCRGTLRMRTLLIVSIHDGTTAASLET